MNAEQLLTYLQGLEDTGVDLQSIDLLEYLKPKHLRRLNKALGRFILFCGARNVYLSDSVYIKYANHCTQACRFMSEADAIQCIPRAMLNSEWKWQIHILNADNSVTFFQDVKF